MRRGDFTPRSLYPAKESEDIVKVFITRYGGVLFCLAIAFAIIVFVSVVLATAPPTESGTYYNHMV